MAAVKQRAAEEIWSGLDLSHTSPIVGSGAAAVVPSLMDGLFALLQTLVHGAGECFYSSIMYHV